LANAVVSRPGQANLTGDPKALFLKVFAGEVLAAFDETNTAKSRHIVRTISSGKSAQFPATGKTTAFYHTPGEEILGQQIAGNERVITIDDLLISPVFIANIDEAMSHFDFRSEYSKQCGAALARAFDQNVYRVLVTASRTSATVSGLSGGSEIVQAAALTNADALIEAAFEAAATLDSKDVPKGNRYLAVKPEQYYLMVNSGSKAIHADYNPTPNGSFAAGTIYRVAGFEIVATNNLPQENVTTGNYQGDFSNVAAMAWHRSAAGTVQLMGLSTESDYEVRRQGTLIVSRMAVGHGVLRPESAVSIVTSATA